MLEKVSEAYTVMHVLTQSYCDACDLSHSLPADNAMLLLRHTKRERQSTS